MIGIPEGMEGDDARLFMSAMFKEVIGGALLDPNLELDCAHCSLGLKPLQGSWPLIVRFHKYTQKERALQWTRKEPGHLIPWPFHQDF